MSEQVTDGEARSYTTLGAQFVSVDLACAMAVAAEDSSVAADEECEKANVASVAFLMGVGYAIRHLALGVRVPEVS